MPKKFSFAICVLILFATITRSIKASDDLVLQSAQGRHIVISIEKQHVTANDRKSNISYHVDNALSRYLGRTFDVQLITNKSKPKAQLFIVLTRELSRPEAMGKGYCGAGYEDYLLLVEMIERKLVLRDQFLLQSCLNSISLFIDRGDDNPGNGLEQESDGSLSYRLVADDYDKKRLLVTKGKRFKIISDPSPADD